MGLLELFILAVGLSMDAFAVSVCKGLSVKKMEPKHALICGAYFSGFQALMPTIGYLLGSQFESMITQIDHWIAFVLLGIIGINMIKESREDEDEELNASFDVKTMLALAVATSIDAMAVGISLAVLRSPIVLEATIIGIVTLLISAFGVFFGNQVGRRIDLKLDLIGGVILIGLGTKILIEHTVLA